MPPKARFLKFDIPQDIMCSSTDIFEVLEH